MSGVTVVIKINAVTGEGLTDEQAEAVEDAVMDLVAGQLGLDYSSERRPACDPPSEPPRDTRGHVPPGPGRP